MNTVAHRFVTPVSTGSLRGAGRTVAALVRGLCRAVALFLVAGGLVLGGGVLLRHLARALPLSVLVVDPDATIAMVALLAGGVLLRATRRRSAARRVTRRRRRSALTRPAASP